MSSLVASLGCVGCSGSDWILCRPTTFLDRQRVCSEFHTTRRVILSLSLFNCFSKDIFSCCECVMSLVWSVCVDPSLRHFSVRLFPVGPHQTLLQAPSTVIFNYLPPRFVSYHGMIGLVCGYVVAVKQYHPDSVPFPPPTPPTLRVKVIFYVIFFAFPFVEISTALLVCGGGKVSLLERCPHFRGVLREGFHSILHILYIPFRFSSPACPTGCGHHFPGPLSVWSHLLCLSVAGPQWHFQLVGLPEILPEEPTGLTR